MSAQGLSRASPPPTKVPKLSEHQNPFISWCPSGPALHNEPSGHKRPYPDRSANSNADEYMNNGYSLAEGSQSTQNNSPAALSFGETILPRAAQVPIPSPAASTSASNGTSSTLQNGHSNGKSAESASKNSGSLSNGSSSQPRPSPAASAPKRTLDRPPPATQLDPLAFPSPQAAPPVQRLPSPAPIIIASRSATPPPIVSTPQQTSINTAMPPSSSTKKAAPSTNPSKQQVPVTAVSESLPLQTQEIVASPSIESLPIVTPAAQPPSSSAAPNSSTNAMAVDVIQSSRPSPPSSSSNPSSASTSASSAPPSSAVAAPADSTVSSQNASSSLFVMSAATPNCFSLEASFASRLTRGAVDPLPDEPAVLQKCVSALRRVTLKMYSCPYAQNQVSHPYQQALKITGLPQMVIKPFSEAFSTLYPFVKIMPSELSNTHLLVVDPARPFDWSQYLLMLHGALIVKRTWVEETIKLNSPPVIDPYLVTLSPDPLNGTLPYFSASLLRGNIIILMEFAAPNIGRIARTSAGSLSVASKTMDMDLRYRIALALQFLGVTFEVWHDSDKLPTSAPQNAILLYNSATDEARPLSVTRAANTPTFAAIWTTDELLAYLSTPSAMPELPLAPLPSY